MIKRKIPKPRNLIAKDLLLSGLYRKRIVQSKLLYIIGKKVMHLSESKFHKTSDGGLYAYCGDLNPPQPKWSKLRPGVHDSEVGVFLYYTINDEVHIIRYVYNDTVCKDNHIESWYLYIFHSDKKDFSYDVPKKIVIRNEFDPVKNTLVFA